MSDLFAFRPPTLPPEATDAECDFAAQYTRIRFIVVNGVPEATTVWLTVEQQSFRLDDHCDTPAEAS